MNNSVVKEKVYISKAEYRRLKKLDERFRDFFLYFENLLDVREARNQIKKGIVVSQEKLFQELGL